jgi:RHS repeat-associated protein
MDGAFNPIPQNAWGTPHSAIGNPYMFTGRQLDEEAGAYFYRARTYDAIKGRFLQRDPAGYVDGLNLYEYVNSNPINRADPMGLQAVEGCCKITEIYLSLATHSLCGGQAGRTYCMRLAWILKVRTWGTVSLPDTSRLL